MRALVTTSRTALAEAWANRAGFWAQALTMVVNDLAWVVFWVLFFRRVGGIRGWDTGGVLLLQAMLTTSGGIVLGLLSNARRIGQLVADGEIDAALALPIHPLAFLLVRRVDAVNMGDLVFGVTLFLVTGAPTPTRVAIYLVGVAAGTTLLTGFFVATGSLAFFTGHSDAGDLGFHAMLLMSAYPANIFTGVTRVLLYTVLPAAFVATVPAQLLQDFDPVRALAMVTAAAVVGLVGWATFTVGLRRYSSGAVWTRA